MMQRLFNGRDPALVLFDLDGTLVDSVPDLARAIDRMLQALGQAPAGIERVRHWVGNGAQVLVKRALAGQHDVGDIELPAALFERGYALFLDYYGEATADQSELYPGVIECLDGLKARGITMAVVTNKPIAFTRTMLDGFGLTPYFAVVLGGDSLPTRKPDPQMLLAAMAECGATAAQSLMVGDSLNDVGAGRNAGCAVACVPYGYNHGQPIADARPDLIVERLDQLL
ncbi:phosphoglycolate phosphatase [Marinobacterium jannaschii]|uniref:phosphoglycolate phosphatase n=1 Tax=Marinobacterium jannaschii TaxID=64970 RepID=UPI0004864BB3|nr:phosphoglycolate phosphatase [Marinobacterium jannaschii]